MTWICFPFLLHFWTFITINLILKKLKLNLLEERWEYLLGKHQVFDNLHVHVSSITMSAEETGDKVFIPRESIPMDFGLLYVHLCMSCYKNVKYKIHSAAFLTPPPPSFLILEEELKELSLPYFCLFIFRNWLTYSSWTHWQSLCDDRFYFYSKQLIFFCFSMPAWKNKLYLSLFSFCCPDCILERDVAKSYFGGY